jgi:glycosyltransferase involved in cell wall biosynthesis
MTKLDPALDATFDIVGGGDQRKQLENLTNQLGLADRVTFHGRTTDDELRALLSRASVFTIASIAELEQRLQTLTLSELEEMRKNVARVSQRLASGLYFKEALHAALSFLTIDE